MIKDSIQHYLDNLKYKQTSGHAVPRAEGFAYAEVPDWQLRQWMDQISLNATPDLKGSKDAPEIT